MKKTFLVLSCFLITINVFSQSASDSVKLVINQLFTGMKTSDSIMIVTSFSDSGILQSVEKSKGGDVGLKSEDIRSFAHQIALLPKGDADERITFDVVKVDADLAIAWTPYQFYYKGKFSHCGVDSFQLVKIRGQWKIVYLVDTRRKDNCK